MIAQAYRLFRSEYKAAMSIHDFIYEHAFGAKCSYSNLFKNSKRKVIIPCEGNIPYPLA